MSFALPFVVGGGFVPCAVMADRTDFDELYTQAIDKAIEKGLAYLQSRELDGAFATPRWGKNIGICSLAGLAFLSRGIRIEDEPTEP